MNWNFAKVNLMEGTVWTEAKETYWVDELRGHHQS